jgi:NADH/NAD ratio-sensing transcriptional regulator Rex
MQTRDFQGLYLQSPQLNKLNILREVASTSRITQAALAQRLEALQGRLINEMVGMFVSAKDQIRERIKSQTRSNLKRVVLFGTGNLAQLAFHALELAGVKILGVCDDNPEMIGRDFCGREVVNPSQIRYLVPDAVIVADSARADEICRNLDPIRNHGIDLIRLDLRREQHSSSHSDFIARPTPKRSA